MRAAYSRTLVELATQDDRVVLLTGDHGYALFDEFRRVCPGQYINAGVAEQNMVGIAAGLAKAGYRPIVYGLSAFVPVRVLEQIKLDVCYEELPVIFTGDGAGLVYSTLGSSHQSTEDVAALRAVPHMTIFSPADAWELSGCFNLAYSLRSPVYMRMGKADLGDVHPVTSRPPMVLGALYPLTPGPARLALIATGSMVRTAQLAAEHLGPGVASVWSAPSLKPLDEAAVTAIARNHDAIVTLEEHHVAGGLGSAIAEIVCEHAPTRVHRIGVADRFSRCAGSHAYLMQEHGLDLATVVERLRAIGAIAART